VNSPLLQWVIKAQKKDCDLVLACVNQLNHLKQNTEELLEAPQSHRRQESLSEWGATLAPHPSFTSYNLV